MIHAMVTGQVAKAGVVIDRSGGAIMQDHANPLINGWRDEALAEVIPKVVAEETDDGPKAVRELLAAGVGDFIYLGPLEATVRTARELSAVSFTGPRWMQHPLYGSDFPRLAGAAGEGWYVVTSAVDPSVLPTQRAKDFTAAWRKRYGAIPEPYATEAYDSVRMLLAEFARTVPAGARRRPVRTDLATRLARKEYQYKGIARTYAFGQFHEYDNTGDGWYRETFVHQVRDGRFQQLGSLADLDRAAQGQG